MCKLIRMYQSQFRMIDANGHPKLSLYFRIFLLLCSRGSSEYSPRPVDSLASISAAEYLMH